jgi:hypothetical protein
VCSPRDLKLETSKNGVDVGAGLELDLDRIFTIEDLMLRTPYIQTTEIDRLSSFIFRLSFYTVMLQRSLYTKVAEAGLSAATTMNAVAETEQAETEQALTALAT